MNSKKEQVLNEIKSIFDKALIQIPHMSYFAYYGSKLRIDGLDSLYIWVGLVYDEGLNKVNVIIENITLDEFDRHKGIFTNMIHLLEKSKYVNNICIQNILSNEMNLACQKLGFYYNEMQNSYYWKI